MIEDSVKKWDEYWNIYSEDNKILDKHRSPPLFSYQRPAYYLLKKIIQDNNLKNARILNAGCGLDLIFLKLKKEFPNLRITLVDISNEILSINKKLFEMKYYNINLSRANILCLPFKDKDFDVVFNTGVLEHFGEEEQKDMYNEILRVTKENGYFITANPSESGKIYKSCMEYSKKRGTWPFGKEEPIKSLGYFLKTSEVDLKEYNIDFISQLNFLNYVHPIFRIILAPIKFVNKNRMISKIFDVTFGRLFGTYLLVSIFHKRVK